MLVVFSFKHKAKERANYWPLEMTESYLIEKIQGFGQTTCLEIEMKAVSGHSYLVSSGVPRYLY